MAGSIRKPPRGRQEVEALKGMCVKLAGFVNVNAEGVVQQSPGFQRKRARPLALKPWGTAGDSV